jgi:hypothetical protein
VHPVGMPRSETVAHGGRLLRIFDELIALLRRSNVSGWWCWMMIVVRCSGTNFEDAMVAVPTRNLQRAT